VISQVLTQTFPGGKQLVTKGTAVGNLARFFQGIFFFRLLRIWVFKGTLNSFSEIKNNL
jgi:hypothetical protein